MLASSAVDFDDLLLHVATLLRENPETRATLDARYRYILVDEYQDTNLAQYTIARALSIDAPNLAVTGDPDQSIYGWRGANLSNILDFEKDYPDVQVVKLEQNYRSTKRILRVADHLIGYNQRRKKKGLFTENDEGQTSGWSTIPTQRDEAESIAAYIASEVRAGRRRPRDFAIFYRVNALSRSLEFALRDQGVPYQMVNGLEFYQRREIKDVLAYLHLINNPRDDVSLLRVINNPPRAIGKSTLARLAEHAARFGLSLLDAARESGLIESLNKRAAVAVAKFVAIYDRLAVHAAEPVEEIMGHVLAESGYKQFLEDSELEEDQDRLANIEELLTAARQFDENHFGDSPLESFLEESCLVNDTDAWAVDDDRVTLMTMHAAKGLEFPVVFIIALEDGLLPHERSRDDSRATGRRTPAVVRRHHPGTRGTASEPGHAARVSRAAPLHRAQPVPDGAAARRNGRDRRRRARSAWEDERIRRRRGGRASPGGEEDIPWEVEPEESLGNPAPAANAGPPPAALQFAPLTTAAELQRAEATELPPVPPEAVCAGNGRPASAVWPGQDRRAERQRHPPHGLGGLCRRRGRKEVHARQQQTSPGQGQLAKAGQRGLDWYDLPARALLERLRPALAGLPLHETRLSQDCSTQNGRPIARTPGASSSSNLPVDDRVLTAAGRLAAGRAAAAGAAAGRQSLVHSSHGRLGRAIATARRRHTPSPLAQLWPQRRQADLGWRSRGRRARGPRESESNARHARKSGRPGRTAGDACRTAHRAAFGSLDGLCVGLQLTHSGRFCRPNGKQLEPRLAYHHPLLDAKFHIDPQRCLAGADRRRNRAVDRRLCRRAQAWPRPWASTSSTSKPATATCCTSF